MYYNRQVKYLDYLENRSKIRSAGFVKIEVKDQNCNILVNINGLYPTDSYQREVWISDGRQEKVLGKITLQQGKGTMVLRGTLVYNLADTGIHYNQLAEIRIKLGKERELYCIWRKFEAKQNMLKEQQKDVFVIEKPEIALENPTNNLNKEQQVLKKAADSLTEKQLVLEKSADDWNKEELVLEKPADNLNENQLVLERATDGLTENQQVLEKPADDFIESQRVLEKTSSDLNKSQRKETKEQEKSEQRKPEQAIKKPSVRPYFYEDKWKQLSYIYPHITPFQDEREYLSISPSDFVILQSKYHKLVNNSFLLHGYYNYEHLILAKMRRKEEEAYYIGVPGNFYEREKQVALMFGFESFECKKEPAQTGDYGYYMIKIEL